MTPFELAKQKRLQAEQEAKRKEEEKKNSFYTKDENHVEWMGLTDTPKAFRIVGLPFEVRESSSDSKFFLWSKWINDTGKHWTHIFWPMTSEGEPDPDFILWRMFNKVMESEWVKYKEGEIPDPNRPRSTDKGYFISKHQGKPSYTRLEKNIKEGSKQYGHIWPKKRIAFNVIDRMDTWCKDNKHTKILSSSHSPFEFIDETSKEKKVIYFTEYGVPNELYKILYSQVLEFRASWDLDLIVHKEEKKYIVRDAFEDKIPNSIKPLINSAPITEEELSYQTYNLDEVIRPISYYKIKNNFEKLFKQVDVDLGTKFFDELNSLYEEEKKAREAENKEQNSSTHPSVEIPKSEESQSENTAPARRGSAKTELTVEEALEKLPGWKNVDDVEKGYMKKSCSKVDGEKFEWKEGTNLIPCSCDKKIPFPDTVFTCPVCPNKVVFE